MKQNRWNNYILLALMIMHVVSIRKKYFPAKPSFTRTKLQYDKYSSKSKQSNVSLFKFIILIPQRYEVNLTTNIFYHLMAIFQQHSYIH